MTAPTSACRVLGASPDQARLLRLAADLAHQPLHDFILDRACEAAERALLDQRPYLVSGDQFQVLLDMVVRPPLDSPGLSELFHRPEPWETL